MAFHGYLETFIHFHSLRNIDLFHQGLYQIRCHSYGEFGPSDVVASIPARISSSPLEAMSDHRKSRIPKDAHCLAPAFISSATRSFTTRTFQIRFCDEEVELNDGITFRMEMDLTKPSTYTAPVYVEVQLRYTEHGPNDKKKKVDTVEKEKKGHGKKKSKGTNVSPGGLGDDFLASPLRDVADSDSKDMDGQMHNAQMYTNLQWTTVAYQVMKIKDPLIGQSEYMQITFDHLHFCVCHCTVYTAFIDVRQGCRQPRLSPVLEVRHNQRKAAPSLTYHQSGDNGQTSASSNTTLQTPADRKQLSVDMSTAPEGLVTPRDSAPYWMTNRLSPSANRYLNGVSPGFDASTLMDHLAAANKCLMIIQGEAKTGSAESPPFPRRLTLDYGVLSDGRNPLMPRASLGPSNLVPPETEITSIVLARADRVYREYMTLLTRNYYRLRAYITTISYRCLSDKENQELNWIWSSGKQFYLPGKLVIEAKPNGLPEQSINLSDASQLGSMSFKIPAHICIDAAKELITTSDVAIAGATRAISIPFYPLQSRLRHLPENLEDSCDTSLLSEMQAVFIEDFNLVWGQVQDVWQKLKVLVSLVHREALYFHQLVWEKRLVARCREVIYLELNSARTAAMPVEQDIGIMHNQISEELRVSRRLKDLPSLPVEDVHAPFDPNTNPIVFEERYTEEPVGGKNVVGGYLEKRDRLSTLHGGLKSAVPEGLTSPGRLGIYRPLELNKLMLLNNEPDAGEIILTNRQRGQDKPSETKTADSVFPDLKALALMKQAGDQTASARAEAATLSVPDVIRNTSASTTMDSIDSSLDPVDEEITLNEDDFRFFRMNCPIFDQSPSAPKLHGGSHLIVLVHGFQGNSMDMRVYRNQLSLIFPEGMYLTSTSNEDQTDGDVAAMGSRLAAEVLSYMTELCPADTIGRISFVAHSLGGLIVRASLPHLGSVCHKFHLFLTLSAPHLGYIFARNRLVDAGIWVLKKWKKSVSLQQLSMSDHREPRETFLYKLSQRDDLRYFRFIVFVSCFQDQYVPYESARVEISDKLKADPQWGLIHMEMVKNILSAVPKNRLTRLDTCFKIADRSIDTFIGRTAHIQFLGSQHLAQMLVLTYPQWFS
eukprot:Blabericola_migrator_1__3339@NODE_1986_length_3454_cov_87_759965_g1264_i0_p1_GENE_NODE_1986_length_3454_cov_87_759965_g1264_i0NODE_1986_length_3454_cov_87_759965_g1264_i0_p1_ORF_typecomplete_len1110_score190_37DUF676/PF05057_14/1_5e26PGAP1/PF07819_13/7_2e03PGAP1/PF07819_13/9_9e10Palm_thioest/PF02089_15/4_2e08DUF3657/PF12394_8/4_1e06LCAT/PF02450_15/0_0004Abhydrolase_6/PF12697_7/0_0027DUF900/PF05990_12/0_018Lipase_2/PF01674_18/0_016DUF915/PF06028_11/2_3e03DUF915/PF06028_11/0_037Hydrolase_4/PF12146